MAKPGVTEAEVHGACDEMLKRGERPTQAKLVKVLGGSNTTIGPYLKTWNLAQDAKERERQTPVPNELAAAWAIAVRQIRSDEDAKWSLRIAEQDEQLAELTASRATLTARAEELEAANLALATERDRLAGKWEAALAGIEAASAERQTALVQAQDAKVSLGQATQTIEGLRARVEDSLAGIKSRDDRIRDLERDLAQAQTATRELASASQAELRQAALELSGVRAHLSAESRVREGAEARVQALESRLTHYDSAISRAAAAESAAEELRRQVEMLQGMLPATLK